MVHLNFRVFPSSATNVLLQSHAGLDKPIRTMFLFLNSFPAFYLSFHMIVGNFLHAHSVYKEKICTALSILSA